MNTNLDEQLAAEAGRWVKATLRSPSLVAHCRNQLEDWLWSFKLEVRRLPITQRFWRDLLNRKNRR
jgi:hypothetical protein